MRLELLFEIDKPELPKDNKSIWISYLKNALSTCAGGKFFEQYFSEGKSKDYSFSILLPKPVFYKEKIILQENQVKMVFSADERNKTGLIFYSAFIANKNKRFMLPNNNAITLKGIKNIKEKQIFSDQIIFKSVTGGGLVIRNHDKENNRDIYFTYADEGFERQAKTVLKNQAIVAGFTELAADQIKILPLECKKIVVKQYGIYVDVTTGLFAVEADPEILQYFYQAGMGSKHSMGYGLMDIVV